jgi:LPS-assembly lipoprotein
MPAASRLSAIWVVLACAVVPMLATGCGDSGFRPLYATSSLNGTSVNQKLAELEIAPVPGRVGQRLRNELIFQATGGGYAAPQATYRLEIVLTESIAATLVQIDGNSSGSVYNLNARFRLIRLDDKSVALEGVSYGRSAFQRFDSVYSNVRARREAEDRAAQTVADDMRARLTAFLSGPV